MKEPIIDKDVEEGLLSIVEDDNGRCWIATKKMVRFENCKLK